MSTKPKFSKRLVELRKERKLSQYKLAEKLGCSRGLISNYEQGTREPDHNTLKMLADFFNVSIDYLIGRSDFRNPDDVIFNNDIQNLNKYYENFSKEIKDLITEIFDKFYLLIIRDARNENKAVLKVYKDLFSTLLDFKAKLKDFTFKRNTLDLPSSLTEIMEIQAKYKGDIGLLLDKLVQTYLEPNGNAKKAMDEMSSALEKHA